MNLDKGSVLFMKVSKGKRGQTSNQLSVQAVPRASSMKQEMQSYDPWDVLEVAEKLLANMAYNMSGRDAFELSIRKTFHDLPEELHVLVYVLTERMEKIRQKNFLSRM